MTAFAPWLVPAMCAALATAAFAQSNPAPSNPVPQARPRPLVGEIKLSYGPVAGFSETINLDGAVQPSGNAKPMPFKAKFTRAGSLAARGGELAMEQVFNAERQEGKAGGSKGTLKLFLTPSGEIHAVEYAAAKGANPMQALAVKALGAVTLAPAVRHGQEIFDLRRLPAIATESLPGLIVTKNTLALRAVGMSGENLVGEASGVLAFALGDRITVEANLAGQCLLDAASALMRGCDLRVRFTQTTPTDSSTGQVRLRSTMDIKR